MKYFVQFQVSLVACISLAVVSHAVPPSSAITSQSEGTELPPGLYVLAMAYPASWVARQRDKLPQWAALIDSGQATPGFFTHGLWPQQKPATDAIIRPFNASVLSKEIWAELPFYMRNNPFPPGDPRLAEFLEYEWDTHGSETGIGLQPWHELLVMLSGQYSMRLSSLVKSVLPHSQMRTGGEVTLRHLAAALEAVFGEDALAAPGGITCAENRFGALQLQEIQLCLQHSPMGGLVPGGCKGMPSSQGTPTCFGPDTNITLVSGLRSRSAFEVESSNTEWIYILVALVALILLLLAWWLFMSRNFVMAVFRSQTPKPVHNPLVHMPMKIMSRPLDMKALRRDEPLLASYVDDLPAGLGIKGGIARKLVKILEGNPEPVTGDYDIDCVVLLDEGVDLTPDLSTAIREQLTGIQIGDLQLEAQDIELHHKSELYQYFYTRDITQNEVFLSKGSDGVPLLWCSEQCQIDCREGRATPAVHCLVDALNVAWDVGESGKPFAISNSVARSVIRVLKGHATQYGFDQNTWRHYRKNGLDSVTLFKVLKPFHEKDDKFFEAVEHLVSIGFLHRSVLRSVGGANFLWGHLMKELNDAAARYGGRLKFNGLDAEAVERWLAQKATKAGRKQVSSLLQARRIGWYPVNESVESLGIISYAESLYAFVKTGPVFDCSAAQELEPIPHSELQPSSIVVQMADAANLKADETLPTRPSESDDRPGNAVAKSSESSQRIARQVSQMEEMMQQKRLQLTRQGTLLRQQTLPRQRTISSATSLRGASRQASGLEAMIEEIQRLQRSDEAVPMDKSGVQEDVTQDDVSPKRASNCDQQIRPPSPPGTTSVDDVAGEFDDNVEIRFFEVANGDGPDSEIMDNLGLVSSSAPMHKVPVQELYRFLLGVISPYKWWMATAWVLLIAGIVTNLIINDMIGGALNSLQAGRVEDFEFYFWATVGLYALNLVLDSSGQSVMQLFAVKAMRRLFTQLFNHLLNQELELFQRLTVAEIVSRTGGDSLSIQIIITTTLFSIISGALQAVASMIFLVISAQDLFAIEPGMAFAAPIGLVAQLAFAVTFGLWLGWPLHRLARQALGQLYGFIFDTFGQVETVQTLGMAQRQKNDYDKFAHLYWMRRLHLNLWLILERSFTSMVGSSLTLLFLAVMGKAYFSLHLDEIGTIVVVIRFVESMQQGVKLTSDGIARLYASLGSVERLVQLHNSGTFESPKEAPVAQTKHQEAENRSLLCPSVGSLDMGLTGSFRVVACSCSYQYKSDVTVLSKISLEVKAGSVAAVVGPSGCGKSTILRVIQMRITPYAGCLEFQASNGQWIPFNRLHHTPDDIRMHMGVCSLDTLGIFFASVETNVACGAANVEMVSSLDVREACSLVGLDKIVNNKLRGGLFTNIGGPSGVELGSNALLCISLARALVRKPKILLFDDVDHYVAVLGIDTVKRVLERLQQGGTAVLMGIWDSQLARQLVSEPVLPGNEGYNSSYANSNHLLYELEEGRHVSKPT